MRFVGDVHGKIDKYIEVIKGSEKSVQVGDMGVGFEGVVLPKIDNHKFIRGNHDCPQTCFNHPNWIPDGTYRDGILYIGGAWSIDHALRIEGVSKWHDEELSIIHLNQIIDLADCVKPRVIVSHDFPEGVIQYLFDSVPFQIRTRTGSALEVIRQLVTPDIWIGGHWHINRDKIIKGTRFICLDELNYIDLEI